MKTKTKKPSKYECIKALAVNKTAFLPLVGENTSKTATALQMRVSGSFDYLKPKKFKTSRKRDYKGDYLGIVVTRIA